MPEDALWTTNYPFTVVLPDELAAHGVRENGDGLLETERYQAALESETYRYVIDLLIDGEPHRVDATFRYDIRSHLDVGIPARP